MYRINKTYGPFSAGTKVELIKQDGPMSSVQLVTPPSEKLLSQRHLVIQEMGKNGIFNIPTVLLTKVRSRSASTKA